MAKLAVVGAGAWGTALACHAARIGHDVTLWAFEPEVAEEIRSRHVNATYLPDAELPQSLDASAPCTAWAARIVSSGLCQVGRPSGPTALVIL